MSSIVHITPLPDGTAIFELNGMTWPFGSYAAAQHEADARGLRSVVDRFPDPTEAHRPAGRAA